ncbi:aspartic proteinase NANA, chloroplast-like [Fagus crenata]
MSIMSLFLFLLSLLLLISSNNNINNHNFLFGVHAFASATDVAAQFELIHRHAPEVYKNGTTLGPPKTRLERIKQLVHSDNARWQTISRRLQGQGQRRMAFEFHGGDNKFPVDIPMRSAADTGSGQYFVSFRVGTPPKKFVLIADTGSDVTWINCCHNCFDSNGTHRIFHPKRSPSFKTIPCLSEMCKVDLAGSFSLSYCPTKLSPCSFDYRYADSSKVTGIFANETVTVGLDLHNHQKMKLHDVLIGCGQSSEGSFKDADGVMGLGYSKHSFAIRVAERFGYKFSYCLVDHLSPSNFASYLSFGKPKGPKLQNMQYTELILGVINPFYAVNVSGISIGGVMLKISSEVWDIGGSGGVIIDSGSTLTTLTEHAFLPVIAAFESTLQKFGIVGFKFGIFKYCFDAKKFEESLVPKLVFHFADGAQFMPPVKSYVIDVADGVKCLGFASSGWPGVSVIGNILQQNHFWEFDLVGKKLGFAPSSCTSLKSKL